MEFLIRRPQHGKTNKTLQEAAADLDEQNGRGGPNLIR
jgi:hypothetical protein